MLVERSAIELLGARVGDVVTVEMGNERQRQMRIAGLVHDPFQVPAQFDGLPYGYISFDTLAWFGEAHGFNELHIVARNSQNKAFAEDVVNQVKDKAEKNGLTIPLTIRKVNGPIAPRMRAAIAPQLFEPRQYSAPTSNVKTLAR